jgi:hypothetical protein
VTGFVSVTLEQEVTAEVRRQGTVVWLDKDGSYTPFVDALAARHAAGERAFPDPPLTIRVAGPGCAAVSSGPHNPA